MKFKRKSIIIEAFKFGYDEGPDWFYTAIDTQDVEWYRDECYINTADGLVKVLKGDYIIKDIDNLIFACKSDYFHKNFEESMWLYDNCGIKDHKKHNDWSMEGMIGRLENIKEDIEYSCSIEEREKQIAYLTDCIEYMKSLPHLDTGEG